MKKLNKILCTILLLSWLTGCSDGRPAPAEAQKEFEQRYPGIKIVSVRMAEDEVIARTYVFRYRKRGSSEESEIEIQFMENPKTKKWSPMTALPKELP